jgi:phosphatidylserine/phosphatidylglycerophosphate/cardiolipin synthase-like enzyme
MGDSKRRLIVMPDDGIQPLLAAIASANRSIEIKMFLFSEARLIRAVIEAHQRGVKTRVMLNPARRSGEADNDATHEMLAGAGVDVRSTHPDFQVTHEKSMVIDEEVAYIKSLNWAPKHFEQTRDYAVTTTHAEEVAEVLACFNADWDRRSFEGDMASLLIWCRGNGRERIVRFIDRASHSLFLQNERYQDMTVVEHLVRSHRRGVKVHLMSLSPHALKGAKLQEGVNALRMMEDVGIKIHKLKGLHLHAKMMLADNERAIVGSMNFSPGSFDQRRELAIEVSNEGIIKRLRHVFEHDWNNSHRMDLTDEGLLKDLEKHGRSDSGSLALYEDTGKKNH